MPARQLERTCSPTKPHAHSLNKTFSARCGRHMCRAGKNGCCAHLPPRFVHTIHRRSRPRITTITRGRAHRVTSPSPTPSSRATHDDSHPPGGHHDPGLADERYERVRHFTDRLTEPLQTEDFVVQSAWFVSPTKWHMAHTSWFFETFILREYAPDYEVFDEDFNFLFNSYYNAVGDQHPQPSAGCSRGPGVEQIRGYRAHVDRHMRAGASRRWAARPRGGRSGCRDRVPSRAAAPGAAADRHQARPGPEPPAPGYQPGAGGPEAPGSGEPAPAGWCELEGGLEQIGFDAARGFASTTSARATRPGSSPSRWPTGW